MPSQVEEKNNRIQEILTDLGSEETFCRPKWLDGEQPEEVFNVSELRSRRKKRMTCRVFKNDEVTCDLKGFLE